MTDQQTLLEQLDLIDKEFRTIGLQQERESELRSILATSKEIKWAEGTARSLFYLSRLHEFNREMKEAEKLLHEAKKLADTYEMESLVIDCQAAKANILLWNNKLKEAYNTALETLGKAGKLEGHDAVILCNYVLGSVSQRYAADDEALQYFQNGLDYAKKVEYLKRQGPLLDRLSGLFLSRRKLQLAERFALQYIDVQNRIGNLKGILRSKIRLLTILIEEGKTKDAVQLTEEIDAKNEYNLPAEKGSVLLIKGKIAQQRKDYDLADKYFMSALKIFKAINYEILIGNAYEIICELNLDRRNASKALSNAKLALKLIKPGTNDYGEMQAYRLMYEASKLGKNTSNALKYLELYNEKFTRQEGQLLESRIKFIELQGEYQMKQAEITKERRRAEALHIELEQKEHELTEKTRHLIKQTESLAQFRDDLRAIIRRSPADDPLIRKIKERLQETSSDEFDWGNFEGEFRKLYPLFPKNLEKKHPMLSAMEKKICSMLRLGLSSIDIAKLLSLSSRNIENHRYRIRKKLALNTEKSLHEYLAAI